MNNNENMIQIENLVKDYKMFTKKSDRMLETMFPFAHKHKKFRAMNNLNLDVKKGEVLGILGRNGAGKSTLLKMITGVVSPSSGSIKVNGKVSSLLELGAAFNGELTGLENIYQHGEVYGLTKDEIDAKKQEIIDFADIGDHLYQPVKTYSSGMFARLAFACAINVDPDILIVDEVLSVGDMAFQLKCFKKFEQFKKKGKTILFVSHSVADILENCTRVIILSSGTKIFDGEVKEGVDTYKKLITGMLDNNQYEENKKNKNKKIEVDPNSWKSHFTLNPDMSVYGTKEANIYDYGIFNSKGEPEGIINNDEEVSIKVKAEFFEDVECPIFTMTIKDFNGKEICGTNTSFLKKYTGKCQKGEKFICSFKQKLRLAPGKYTLSISCTKINAKGELVPLNRNYDAIIFEVMSKKSFVGYFDLDSEVDFEKIN